MDLNLCLGLRIYTLSIILILSNDLFGQSEVMFWLKPEGVESNNGVDVDEWTSSHGDLYGVQESEELKPIIQASSLNDENGVLFEDNSFLNFSQDVDFVGGDKTFMILFQPLETNYGLFSRGRAQSSNSQDGDFTIFPFQSNFRIKWQEGSNILGLEFPNISPSSFYLLRVTIDRVQSSASAFINETVVATVSCESSYSYSPINRVTLIGSYPNAPVYNFNGVIMETVLLSSASDHLIDSVLFEMGGRYLPRIQLGGDITLNPNENCVRVLDAGEGYTSYKWSTGSESQTITVNEPGTYSVVARGDFGLLTSDTITIGFGETLIDEEQLLCSYDSLLWDLGLDEGYTLTWSDDLVSTNASRYLHPGESYSVEISNGFCSVETPTVYVASDDFSNELELNTLDLFCQGNELYLESGAESAVSYAWSTDEETPSIVPETDGTYWVEAVNVNGCVGRDTVEVVFSGVAPAVEYTVGAVCEENLVEFTDATEPDGGNTAARVWSIEQEGGESEEFSGEEIVYEAGEPGDLYVSLLVTLDNGCTGLVRDTLTVSPLPLVGFNYDDVIACRGNEVAYESETGVPGGGGISQYRWDFGNGEIDFGVVGSTVFEEMGVNTVKHIVRTTAGCVDSLEADIVVLGSPVVDFVFDTVCVGSPTGFYEVVDVSESGPVFYQWSFGDGFTSNFPNTSHEYADAGTYVVTLTATGNNFGNAGCMDAATKTVSVFEAPVAEITTMDGCLNEGGVLVDETEWASTGGQADPIASRIWRLESNGQVIGTDSVVYYLPEEPGNYAVTFAFETAAGCTGEANGSVEVLALPVSSFEATWPFVEPPVEVEIVNASEDATAYSWLLDGVEVSTAFEPTIVLPAGDFVIDLVASNVLGCADTSSQAGTVIVPKYDIAIVDIYYNRVGSRLELSALIGNNGNVPITSFDMEVQIGRDINYRESVETLIPAGELIEYSLDADFQYVPGRVLPYTCITLSNPNGAGENETDLTNNEVCIGLDKEKATFIPPYPNPASEVVNLGFVMPRDGVVEVEMVSSEGRVVYSRAISLLKGYDVVEVDLRNFSEGMYYLRYEYEGDQEVFKVVIGN